MRGLAFIVSLSALVTGCATAPSPAGRIRFANAEPVRAINDRRPIDEPAETPFPKSLYHFDGHFHRRLTRAMEMRGSLRAANVNSMDEVPDSTWFTNRIGVRDLSVEEIKAGPPGGKGSPEAHRPWTIISSKVGGKSVGFIIKDSRGIRYLLKFDKKGHPETDTAADVIVARLLHACGYNVPEDHVVYFHRDDLMLAPDAKVKDPFGNKRPMTEDFVDEQLAQVNVAPDGGIRGLVSRFIEGKVLGPAVRDWTREDDPNDVLPHYLRRDLRGQYSIFSWMEHSDIKGDNTLDVYVSDPANSEVEYVKHYLIDFGNSLGVMGDVNNQKFIGFANVLDFGDMARSLASLGLYRRRWEFMTWPRGIRGVGLFTSKVFDPGHFKSYTPSYFPFLDADRFDKFWGAKIVIRFTPEQIRTAVEVGRYSDPRATEYMVKTLIERQRIVARYWFERVNPLDVFVVDASADGTQRLCFDDLMIKHDLDFVKETTSYVVEAFDYQGRALDERREVRPAPGGRVCIDGLVAATTNDGYTIVSIDTRREQRKPLAPVLVHLARNRDGVLRVIGLRRN